MPDNWLVIPFSDQRIEPIKKHLKVIGVPMLVIINGKTGEVIRENARQEVFLEGAKVYHEWINYL
jgi:hypothetical protein